MAKKQGKVVKKSLSEAGLYPAEKMQILSPNGEIAIIKAFTTTNLSVFYSRVSDNSAGSCLVDELSVLMVECLRDNGKINPINPYKHIPLKYSQWQSAIDNGEVDNENKYVTFEVKSHDCEFSRGNPPAEEAQSQNGYVEFAKIIPDKKKAEKELLEIFLETERTFTDCLSRYQGEINRKGEDMQRYWAVTQKAKEVLFKHFPDRYPFGIK